MKSRNLYILIFFILGHLNCSKWVEYDPHESFLITDLDFLKSESDYRNTVISAYSPLQWLNLVVVIGDIASDNSVCGGENASDALDLQQIDDRTLSGSVNNGVLTDIWQSAYEGINRVNYLTQYKSTNPAGEIVDFPGKEALYGEVYFLRAFYYFTLVKMWGDVPLFVDKRLSLEFSGSYTRSPTADVYSQIETDLTEAIKVLPTTQIQKGRITRYAAQALLAKVYIYQNKYSEALPHLLDIINSNRFSLVSDFESIFLPEGENGPESVFEIQYSNLYPYYNWNGGQTKGQGNYAVQLCGVRNISGLSGMPFAPGWSFNLPTQELADAYDDGDQRKDATIFNVEAYKNANPNLSVSYQVAPYKNTGLYNYKYLPRIGQTSGQPELNYSNNYRTIRYADVLLMAAEAYLQSENNVTQAQNYLNKVRQRAFKDNNHNITSNGTALFDAILNERRLELAMEGERFFDLVRTNKASTFLTPLKKTISHNNSFTPFVSPKNNLFPIPLLEIQISKLTQNTGY